MRSSHLSGCSAMVRAPRARACPSDRRRATDRQSERGSDAPLRSGAAGQICVHGRDDPGRRPVPLPDHRYVRTRVRSRRRIQAGGNGGISYERRHTRRATPTRRWRGSGGSNGPPTCANSSSSSTTRTPSSMRLRALLRERLQPTAVHPAIAFALAAFNRVPLTTNIGAVTQAIGMSAKRFIERFKAQVGVSPKRLLSDSALPAGGHTGASRPRGRLDASRPGLRILRPGPFHSRVPGLCRPHADRISRMSDRVSEPRQISTIRRLAVLRP